MTGDTVKRNLREISVVLQKVGKQARSGIRDSLMFNLYFWFNPSDIIINTK